MRWKDAVLGGWGRASLARTLACRPERLAEAAPALTQADGSGIIAYGMGRSYGDEALNSGGRCMLTERLDRLLSFDDATGDLVAEAGVTIRDLVDIFLPRGWLPPVMPGTAFVTLGGALANDVHGKNHDSAGSFGNHVQWFDLLAASGEILRVSRDTDPRLFAATIGGLGLTGIVLHVCLRLMRVPSNALAVADRRMLSLDHFLESFAEVRDSATYSVGWIDGLSRGLNMGRGILTTAEPSPQAIAVKPRRKRRVPVDFPSFALNPLSIGLFNDIYGSQVPREGRGSVQDYDRFLFPLDAILQWNRIYGKRGFRQFQCVLPDIEAPRGLQRLLEEISGARSASFLAVLKTLGGTGEGLLSFPMRGFTLALDFPNKPGLADLLARLERITRDHGGRIYLAKDSALSPEGFAAMYPDLDAFRAVLQRIDPQGRMQSDLARRLAIRSVVQ